MTCAILVLLFAGQRFGTSKVGFTFAPIVIVWFTANVMVNLYNIIVYYPGKQSAPAVSACAHHGAAFLLCSGVTLMMQIGVTSCLRILSSSPAVPWWPQPF